MNRCFRKLPRSQDNGKKGTKGGYWTVDVDQLNNTNFGRQILDSGFLGSIEYWHHEQQQQLRHVMVPSSSTSTISSMSTSSSSSSIQQQPPSQTQRMQQPVEEIDFNNLMPFYSTSPSEHPSQQQPNSSSQPSQRHYTTDVMDNQNQNSFFNNNRLKRNYDGNNNNTNDNNNPNMNPTSSKTSSVRDSTSPDSQETEMNTSTFQPLAFQRQQSTGSQVIHHSNKLDMDPLLNPSLMRVNNILN